MLDRYILSVNVRPFKLYTRTSTCYSHSTNMYNILSSVDGGSVHETTSDEVTGTSQNR